MSFTCLSVYPLDQRVVSFCTPLLLKLCFHVRQAIAALPSRLFSKRMCASGFCQDNHKVSYIQQLRPTQTVQPRIKLKLFGHSGAGKSSLLESLKCGILRSFFRRRRTRMTNAARHPNSPVNSKPAGREGGRGRALCQAQHPRGLLPDVLNIPTGSTTSALAPLTSQTGLVLSDNGQRRDQRYLVGAEKASCADMGPL